MKDNRLNDVLAAHKKMNDYFTNKDMKTVEDAVRLHKGDFPDGQCSCYGGWELHLGKLFCNSVFICTRQEFEDYAKKWN